MLSHEALSETFQRKNPPPVFVTEKVWLVKVVPKTCDSGLTAKTGAATSIWTLMGWLPALVVIVIVPE
jgi:hypothetical protein